MKKIGKVFVTGILLLSIGCAKHSLKMPQLKMPEMLQADKPEVKVQKKIAVILAAGDDAKYFREIRDLLDLARSLGWDNQRLLSEIIDYAGRVDSNDELAKLDRMLDVLKLPKTAIVDVAASRLESGEGREEAYRGLLKRAAGADARGPVDFSAFHPYLESHKNPPPQALVLWMYQRDPAGALREMMSLYDGGFSADESRAVLIATRVVDQMVWKQRVGLSRADERDELAVEQVEKMAQSNAWWVRLYAAEVMAQYPGLRKAEVVKHLAGDENGMVKKAMERVGRG